MSPTAWGALAVVAAYLIGAVPFAYVIVRWRKGIDIRTVGSGNVGATNAGRLLGFRYFVLIFLLDLGKGLLPTLGFPIAVASLAGREVPGLGVLVALATILGHNFPIYLKFRGGKGVATSLGALTALDPWSSLAAAVTFGTSLGTSRFVSLSSVLGGIAFALVHFLRTEHPWAPGQWPMSMLTIGLLGMLIVRHRKNFARIAAGTEPKVGAKKTPPPPPPEPSGRAGLIVIIGLVLAGTGTGVALRSARPGVLDCGPIRLAASPRTDTGHQRAERLAFLAGGERLAVTCPRYNRVVLYRVGPDSSPTVLNDVVFKGRPIALAPARDRLYVLQRPVADARHTEPAYWETVTFDGDRIGPRFQVGYDPDDLLLTPDGRLALVLLSGKAEGEWNRPDPSLLVVDLTDPNSPRPRGLVSFDHPGDDPFRLALSESDPTRAAVSLRGTAEVAWLDLSDPDHPRVSGRSRLPGSATPGAILFQSDGRLLAADEQGGPPWTLDFGGGDCRSLSSSTPSGEFVPLPGLPGPSWIVATDPEDSALALLGPAGPVGRLPLHGTLGLGSVRLMGLAATPKRLAVADRSGGVHLVRVSTDPP